MKHCVLDFSRTGNTKGMAEGITSITRAPIFYVASSELSVAEDYDRLVLVTPVEGFRPTKEITEFIEDLTMTEDRKAILFCTHTLWKGITFKTLKKELNSKGYEVVLCVSKNGIKPDKPEDFS